MNKRKHLVNFLLLTIVLASFAATLVSGGFTVSEVLTHASNSIVNPSFINTLVSVSLLLVSFALLQLRLSNRDSCETQLSSVQKYIDSSSANTKSRLELIKLKERSVLR